MTGLRKSIKARADVVLAIVGSVSLADNAEAEAKIENAIRRYKPSRIVSGGAAGIDTMAIEAAKRKGIAHTIHFPGKQAWGRGEPNGFEARNRLVAEDCTHLVRIVASDTKTYGSGWTRDRAHELGKIHETHVVNVAAVKGEAG